MSYGSCSDGNLGIKERFTVLEMVVKVDEPILVRQLRKRWSVFTCAS